jgi:hypothetical protein
VRHRGAQSEPLAVIPIHNVKQRSVLRSRGALLRPGWSLSIRTRPEEGWAERRQAHYLCCRVCETRRSARVRRGASHDAGRSPLGAPPWRFSAGGRASISGISSGSVQRCSSQPGHNAWRAVSRTSRARGYEPRPQDATPRSAFRIVSRRRPSMSEDGNLYTINSLRSQYRIRHVVIKALNCDAFGRHLMGQSARLPMRQASACSSSLFRHVISIASLCDPGHRQPNNEACTLTFTVR